jgi:hypothetical protein
MLIVFPAHPVTPGRAEPAFEDEVAAARAAGFAVGFASLEIHFGGDLHLRVPKGEGAAVYRGWILRVEDYARLESALAARGYALVTTAAAYQHCHFLPEWYEALGGEKTPRSIWFPGRAFDMAAVKQRLRTEFGEGSVILKDYVKSRKHEWFDACFIRSAADEAEVDRVVSNFLRLQGEGLVGGLVFREFIDFKRIGIHSKSRMPLVREFRFFVFDGELVTQAPYWGEGRYDGAMPSPEILGPLIPRIKSRFFAIDVAQKEDGSWLVMELNDGGSAGVPDGGDVREFYTRLANRVGVPPEPR